MADLTTLLSRFLSNLAFFSGSVSGVLTTNTTSYTTVGTSEEDAWTYSLPANALNVNGQTVRLTAFGTFAATANNKTAKLYFGSTVVASIGPGAFNATSWRLTAEVVRTGATAQVSSSIAGQSTSTFTVVLTPAETLSGAVTIKATLTTPTILGDASFKGAVVELLN